MLNYIFPPIIIIACVAYLIVFLFRKIDQLPEQELSEDQHSTSGQKKMALLVSVLGQFGLKILERMMHKAKLLSLKFHNVSNDMFQSIREKRQRKIRAHQEIAENLQESPTLQKPYSADILEKEIRPMIKQEITRPEKTVIEKNKLEDALIKRIAINPRDIEAYERLGDYYLESKNYQDSLECFKQVLHLSPMHQKARLRIRRLQRVSK